MKLGFRARDGVGIDDEKGAIKEGNKGKLRRFHPALTAGSPPLLFRFGGVVRFDSDNVEN